MKAYKGFDKNMQCRGFQYEVGKTYETKRADLCETGFHACESPLDVFGYYEPSHSRYCEVELDGVTDQHDKDSKRCGTKISIGAEIGIPGLVKAHIEYVKSRVSESVEKGDSEAVTVGEKKAATAGYRGAATAGNYGAATAGDSGAATAGYRGAATAGNYGAATAGDSGTATAGDSGAATAGDSGAATAGDSGTATAGNYGAANSRGSSKVGENGSALSRGNGVKVSGGIGAVLVLVEENDHNYDIIHWKAFVIDGEKYKPDTWYCLDENGEIIEAEVENAK